MKRLFESALILAAGIGIGWAVSSRMQPVPDVSSALSAPCPTPSAAMADGPTCAVPSAVASQPVATAIASGPASVSSSAVVDTSPAPQVEASLKPGDLTAPQEDRLRELVERPLPRGRIVNRTEKPQGRTVIHEELPGGETVDRVIGASGNVLSETLIKPNGERITRAYAPGSTDVRGLSWARPDGSQTDLKFAEGGRTRGRMERLPNGDRVVFRYDDIGRLHERWLMRRNGQRQRLE